MSRGPGAAQQKILALLAERGEMTVAAIAAAIERSDRQVRRAVASLERLRLVQIRHTYLGHVGTGAYGPMRRKQARHRNLPTASRPRRGTNAGHEMYRAGMPTHGHVVALLDAETRQRIERLCGTEQVPPPSESP